jgi:hypothetical protein
MNKALPKQKTVCSVRQIQTSHAAVRDIHFAYASYRTIQHFL